MNVCVSILFFDEPDDDASAEMIGEGNDPAFNMFRAIRLIALINLVARHLCFERQCIYKLLLGTMPAIDDADFTTSSNEEEDGRHRNPRLMVHFLSFAVVAFISIILTLKGHHVENECPSSAKESAREKTSRLGCRNARFSSLSISPCHFFLVNDR